MLYFMTILFKIYIYLVGTTNGIWCHSPDEIRISKPTAKMTGRDVLSMRQDKFSHVGWTRLWSHCTFIVKIIVKLNIFKLYYKSLYRLKLSNSTNNSQHSQHLQSKTPQTSILWCAKYCKQLANSHTYNSIHTRTCDMVYIIVASDTSKETFLTSIFGNIKSNHAFNHNFARCATPETSLR